MATKKVKTVKPAKCQFKVGEVVSVKLPEDEGWAYGKITDIILKKPTGKGELMWGIPWDAPKPLIGIYIPIEDRKLYADGNDLKKKNIIPFADAKVIEPLSLIDLLTALKVAPNYRMDNASRLILQIDMWGSLLRDFLEEKVFFPFRKDPSLPLNYETIVIQSAPQEDGREFSMTLFINIDGLLEEVSIKPNYLMMNKLNEKKV